MSEGTILETRGLTRRFGEFLAIDGIDIEQERDQLRGIIGPNGAGKSTLFNCISGRLEPSSGTVLFKGEDVTSLPPNRRARRGMAHSLQVASLFPELTVVENVIGADNATFSRLSPYRPYRNDGTVQRAEELLDLVGLGDVTDTKAGNLSHADQKRLDIALALASEPELLLLDEPVAGLSSGETQRLKRLIADLASDHSILLIEHDMEVVMDLVDVLTVLHHGQVLAEGTPEEIQGDDRVKEIYFGRGLQHD